MLLTLAAVIILTAIAVAAATRFNLVMTLIVCSLVFVLGAMLQYWLWPGRHKLDGTNLIPGLAGIDRHP